MYPILSEPSLHCIIPPFFLSAGSCSCVHVCVCVCVCACVRACLLTTPHILCLLSSLFSLCLISLDLSSLYDAEDVLILSSILWTRALSLALFVEVVAVPFHLLLEVISLRNFPSTPQHQVMVVNLCLLPLKTLDCTYGTSTIPPKRCR